MKGLKLKFGFLATMFAMVLFIVACGGSETTTTDTDIEDGQEQHDGHHNDEHEHDEHNHDAGDTETMDLEGPEFTSAYVCPMHCKGSGSAEAGQCPDCGMDYVALSDHTEDGHSHE